MLAHNSCFDSIYGNLYYSIKVIVTVDMVLFESMKSLLFVLLFIVCNFSSLAFLFHVFVLSVWYFQGLAVNIIAHQQGSNLPNWQLDPGKRQ